MSHLSFIHPSLPSSYKEPQVRALGICENEDLLSTGLTVDLVFVFLLLMLS